MPPAWLEWTPLASSDAPTILSLSPGGASVPLRNSTAGLALVCVGGEDVAVSCEQSYLAAGSSFTPALARGVRVAGSVFVGRLPAAGARVSVVPKSLRSARFVLLPLRRDPKTGKLLREVGSDAAGRFETPELAPGDYILEVVPPGGRLYHTDPFSVPRREALLPRGAAKPGATAVLDLGPIRFDEGARIEVLVTGPGGEPLAGARVGALQGTRPEDSRFFETAADAAGKAVLAGFDPAGRVSLTCQAAGHLLFRQDFETPPGALSCELQPLAVLEGAVRDGEDRPLAWATVSLAGSATRAATGKDGRFTLSGLAPGAYRLVVAAAGFQIERIAVEIAAGEHRTLPPVDLLPGREVRAVVRDARTRQPIAGASVTAVEPLGAVAAVSDGEGELTLTVDDEERLRLEVAAEGYPAKTVEVDPAHPESRAEDGLLVFELAPGGRIRVAIWDEEAGAPCQGCQVTLQGSGGLHSLVTDGAGEALSEPLAPGRYNVTPSIVESFGSVVTRRGGYDNRQVEVRSGEIASAQFGDPTPTVRVRLAPGLPEGWSLWERAGAVERVARQEEDGSFRVRKPAGEAVVLSLSGEGASTRIGVLARDDSRSVELPLPGGALVGKLVEATVPAAARRVQVVAAADPQIGATSTTAADGSFALRFLPAGTYTVVVDGQPVRTVGLAEGEIEDLGTVELGG